MMVLSHLVGPGPKSGSSLRAAISPGLCFFWGGGGGGGHEISCKPCRTFCFLILAFLMSITSYFVEFPEIWV